MNIDPPISGKPVLPGVGRHRRGRRSSPAYEGERLQYLDRLSPTARGHTVAVIGEFAGTFLFLFFAFGAAQVANSFPGSDGPAKFLYISLAFGFSLAVNAWAFFRISGGLFNPAVTAAMCLVGSLSYVRGGLISIAQIVGAIAAAGVTGALFPGKANVNTQLGGGTSIVRGLFIEMFLTAELIFVIFMLAAEKNRATFIAPLGIGLGLFIAELSGVYYTGGSLNPARSFGPAVVSAKFDGYHWIYWLGPLLGALLASAFYKLVKVLEYETANPSPDYDEHAGDQEGDDGEGRVRLQSEDRDGGSRA